MDDAGPAPAPDDDERGTRELRLVVTAPDYDGALHLYRDVLGLREEASFTDENGGRAALLHAGRATVELADPLHAEAVDALEVGRRVAGPVRLAFEVPDAETAARRLADAGARVVADPVRTPWGSVNARLDGPDGQHLTVYSSAEIHVADRPRLDDTVTLAEPDPDWPARAAALLRGVRDALGPVALCTAHVGSTSVPGLPAKPVLDLLLLVPDPADEDAYVPALEAAGYHLHLREPEWHEHRLLRRTDTDVNLHVHDAGSDEAERMLAFRDHLRRDTADRETYLAAKRELAGRRWAYVQDYADAKSDVVEGTLRRALAHRPPLRETVVLVTGADAGRRDDLARGLAARLSLPLLAAGTLPGGAPDGADDHAARARDPEVVQDAVLALAAQAPATGGACVVTAPGRAEAVAALAPYASRTVEVAADEAGLPEAGAARWPVLPYAPGSPLRGDAADAGGTTDRALARLARAVRQAAEPAP